MDPQQAKHILLVDGYVRHLCNKINKSIKIPDDINILIFIFFSDSGTPDWAFDMTEQWDKWDIRTIGTDFRISTKRRQPPGTIMRIDSKICFPCVYGEQIINSGCACWRFENLLGFHWIIGIANADELITRNNENKKILYKDCLDCYVIEGGYGNKYHNGIVIERDTKWMFDCVGDAICMCFDFDMGTLMYSINRHEWQLAFADIDKTTNYRMVVCAGGKNQKIQLQASKYD
eukprot:368302_1